MGDDTTSTVHTRELPSVVVALETAETNKQNGHHRNEAFIYTKNQVAIESSTYPSINYMYCIMR